MALVQIVGTWKKCFFGFSESMFIFVGDKGEIKRNFTEERII